MPLSFFRRQRSDSYRSRMAAERERVRQSMSERTSGGPVREQPWWKEILGIGTKREWMLSVVVVLFLVGRTYEQDGPWPAVWAALLMVGGLLIGARMKRREREAEGPQKPVLGLRDSERDVYGSRD